MTNKFKKLLTSPKGFTLIELIVVFSTIAFLSIVGIASYVTYSQSQSLEAANQELVTTIQLAKSRANSQVKPLVCQNEPLDGYSVKISDTNQYKLNVVCSGNSWPLQTTTLPNNIAFDNDKTTTTEVFFAVITGGVSGSGTIAITGYNQTRYIIVDSVGIAQLSLSPPPTPKRVFVTSTTYRGNLGGITGGDAKCQARADDPNNDGDTSDSLGGTWKAWLSLNTPIHAKDRITWTGEYRLVDGITVVANNKADLIDRTIANAINRDENNAQIASVLTVWTGTAANGDYDGARATCSGWSSDSGWGTHGNNQATDSTWTAYNVSRTCSVLHRLYCFEQ